MDMVNVRDLFRKQEEYVDQTVTIGGWVRSIRNSKNFGFIVVNDGTFFEPVQVVYSNVLENFDDVEKLNVGAAIIVTGKLVATPGTKQPFEIQAEQIEIEGVSTPDYPLQKKKHSFEYLRTISHLRPRTNTFEAVFRVWSETPVDDTTGADSTTQTSDNNNNDTDETDNAAADAQAADEAAGTSDSADSYQLFTLDSYATSMSEIQKLISTNAAEPVWSDIDGQYYVQYENNGITYKIWVEDAASLEEK